MTGRPKLDRSLADQLLARAALSERRYRYLLDLAKRHRVDLPPMYVGDEHAIDHALDVLQDAGAVIDWSLIELPQPTERRNP